ncbi:VRR-NUC domain-containing protein [Schleiferilactobacillus shenzhenensis]|uniref:VRR-NUC domain-containing protein n=1 Tax=Schleiferilactobacillus shenzhenensis LY-73 TaxID=1231336 RepID=U4TKV8_9LACO|nr:VRR-NUC domain-containing protein [Schleiferilactobacillus shenzhenensis]ERL64020.1 hypothetical protein L248_1667 [Schleiferilactobacillus shenzhenensis LY-73]
MTAEAKIQNDIRVAVSQHGCTIIRTNSGRVKTTDGRIFIAGPPPGWPDLTGFRHRDGKLILIEVKTPTGRLRHDQEQFKAFIESKPVLYGVARSVEDALKIIEGD